jgi:replication factor C small subunit
MKEDFLWTEKYRPTTLADCILPERVDTMMAEYFKSGEFPNLLLSGKPGCGKGSLVNAIIKEMEADHIFINCSENGNIDTIRTTVRNFASSVSMMGTSNKKVVVLDEFDYSNAQSTQPAMRAFIEEFSKNAMFIFTANYPNRIIPALKSRVIHVDYDKEMSSDERSGMMKAFMKRVFHILKVEEIAYDPRTVAALIKQNFPDFRKTINILQQYAVSGEIDSGILINKGSDVDVLVDYIVGKEFDSIRKWVKDNPADIETTYSALYTVMEEKLEGIQLAQAILILAKYQYQSSFCADPKLNFVAGMVEIMIEIG